MTDPNADPTPIDPRNELSGRLLKLSAALATARAAIDAHRQALASYEQYDSFSALARNLRNLLEVAERSVDFSSREVASASARLAADALADMLKVVPDIDAGGAKP